VVCYNPLMKNLLAAGSVSFVVGVLGHAVFYPVINSWRNDRMRDLSRPAIGVLLNAIPFLAWLRAFRYGSDCEGEEELAAKALSAYVLSFVWNAAGVVCGYVAGDLIKMIKER
jgi:hypothetical protein